MPNFCESIFEDVQVVFRKKEAVSMSAYTYWPWEILETKEMTEPLRKKEIENPPAALPKIYPGERGNPFAEWEREHHLLRICWLAKNFNKEKAFVSIETLEEDLRARCCMGDGNHTLAAALYLGISPFVHVDVVAGSILAQQLMKKTIEVCTVENAERKFFLGKDVISFSEKQTYQVEFNAIENKFWLNSIHGEAIGNCGLSTRGRVYFYNKGFVCETLKTPEEKISVFLDQAQKITGAPFSELKEAFLWKFSREKQAEEEKFSVDMEM